MLFLIIGVMKPKAIFQINIFSNGKKQWDSTKEKRSYGGG
jgi:hypothetical protein